jgi:hypothetical protein
MLKKKISKAFAAMAIAKGLLGTIGVAQAQDYGFVKGSLYWSARDQGFNEGALCGFKRPARTCWNPTSERPVSVRDSRKCLGRPNMMRTAQAAFNLGCVDAAVNTAICSQIHNAPVYNYLARNRDLIISAIVQV